MDPAYSHKDQASVQVPEEELLTLQDLPHDVLLSIVSHQQLTACDVASLACTSRFFHSLVTSSACYSLLCETWLARECIDDTTDVPITPSELRSSMGFTSYAMLYEFLYRTLKRSPIGLWMRINPGVGGTPYGQLVMVSMVPGSRSPSGDTHAAKLQCVEVGEHGLGHSPNEIFTMYVSHDEGLDAADGRAIPAGEELTEEEEEEEEWKDASGELRGRDRVRTTVCLLTVPGSSPRGPQHGEGHVDFEVDPSTGDHVMTVSLLGGLYSDAHVYKYRRLRGLPFHLLKNAGSRTRSPLGPPPSRPVEDERMELPEGWESDPIELLRRLEGLFIATYGSHGIEIIRSQVLGTGVDVPPGVDVDFTGPRLQGFKVTGDPNVPCDKHTFTADLSRIVIGPVTNESVSGPDPFTGQPDHRPILSFYSRGRHVSLVDLEERGVLLSCPAQGQINRNPPVWAPEWDPAVLLLYKDGNFGILFNERSESLGFRHVIDFTRLPLHQLPSWRPVDFDCAGGMPAPPVPGAPL